MNYPYTAENLNCWYQLSKDVKPKLAKLDTTSSEHIYLVSVEDEDGE